MRTAGRPPRRAGWTLIEVLVAATVLTVFVLACSAAFTTAAQLQRRAAQIAMRTALLERFVVAAGPDLAALPACSADEPSTPVPCAVVIERCTPGDDPGGAGTVRCDGGSLLRARLRVVGGDDEVGSGPPWQLEVWAVAP